MTSDIHITQIAKGIYKIGPLDTKRITANTSPFVVVGSERVAVVEPGEDGQVPELVQGLRRLIGDLDKVAYLIPTHIHLHHMQGAPWLMEDLTKAKLVLHPRAVPHVIEPTRLIETSIQAWGDECYGPFPGLPEDKVMRAENGQVFDLGGKELEIVYTPGHAPHHVCILDRETRAVWIGDLCAGGGGLGTGRERGRPEMLPPLFDVEISIQSLRRVRDLKPSMFFAYNHIENHAPYEMLDWVEEAILAVERICKEGMEKKMNFKELSQRVEAYYESMGAGPPGESTQVIEGTAGAPFGLIAYLKRKYPNLEMPAGATPKMRS